ncbi:MAG: hypothetical protein U0797_17170 [Gemmataceae bacterium]
MRDFSYIAPELPEDILENCTGCMDCVTECPDTAILGKVLSEAEWEQKLAVARGRPGDVPVQWSKTKKYYDAGKKKHGQGGMFQIIIDLSKWQGLRRVRDGGDDLPLKMVNKTDDDGQGPQEPPLLQGGRPQRQEVHQRQPARGHDALHEQTMLYTGAPACAPAAARHGALRMLYAATGQRHGDQWGLPPRRGATPSTPRRALQPVPAPDQLLFVNAPTYAIGVRMLLGPDGLEGLPAVGHRRRRGDVRHRLPVLSRLFASGMNIKVFVLDTQVYSNTGGHRRPRSATPARTPR